jgi:Sigma-70 region 2
MSPGTDGSHAQLARVVRQHAGHLAASLMQVTGDFATAEDLVQDAVVAALQHWPMEGIPQRPDAWLFTVARRRGLDALRRQGNYRAKLAQLQWPPLPDPDERLRLIFTCCMLAPSKPHPAARPTHSRTSAPNEVSPISRFRNSLLSVDGRQHSRRPPLRLCHPAAGHYRRPRKNPRRSSASSSGSSMAVKWPPRGMSVKRRRSP